jgi:uncharacterized phage protein (TIGR01671 family)
MREIKFRAWCKKERKMLYFDGKNDTLLFTKNEGMPIRWDFGISYYDWAITGATSDDDCLMQDIGLKDKYGKEIFEGDIVKCYENDFKDSPYIRKIHYFAENDYPAFDLAPHIDCDCNGLSHYIACGVIEIIGNIYQDSHLLVDNSI